MPLGKSNRKIEESLPPLAPAALPIRAVSPRLRWALAVALAAATFAVYVRTLTHDFVYLDDRVYVTENPVVQKGLTFSGIRWAFTTFEASNYHPLTWLSHMLDCSLYGLWSGGHHLTSLLLHVANVVLLFHLLWRMTGAVWPSAFVAGAFGLHPAHVESVAWVAERKDVLSTCLGLLTLLAYVRFVEGRRSGWYLIVMAAFVLSLLAKPMMVTLPALMLLLDHWPLRRVESWTRLFLEKAPLFLLSAASSVVTVIAQKSGGAVVSRTMLAFDDRVANAVVSYAKYLWMTFWPAGLAVYYPLPLTPHRDSLVMLCGGLLLAITVGAVTLRRSHPNVLIGWLWFVGMLVPVIGLVQVGGQAMADRYTYIPIVGIFIMIAYLKTAPIKAAGVSKRAERKAGAEHAHTDLPPNSTPALPRILGAGVLIALSICTVVQVRYWRDNFTLFQRAIDVVHDNAQGHLFMANSLQRAGRLPEAIAHFSEAVRIVPNEPYNVTDYGHALLDNGQFDEAAVQLQRALTLLPGYADAHYYLGLARLAQKRDYEAAMQFEKALARGPQYTKAHLHAGTAYARLGQHAPAIIHLQKWLAIDPQSVEGLTQLAQVYHSAGNLPAARDTLRKAAAFHPRNPHPLAMLAQMAAWEGDVDAAIADYNCALKLDPTYAEAANNLAEILATHPSERFRDGPRAVQLAETAAKARGMTDPVSLDTLAAAYAEVGRFDDARRTIATAIELARPLNSKPLLDHLEARQALYAAGQPARARS